MSITAEKKQKVILKYARHEGDTGSPEVQIAVLSERILSLTGHMKTHKKDLHSRLGLIKMVSRRRRLLNYLTKIEKDRYTAIVKELGLRR